MGEIPSTLKTHTITLKHEELVLRPLAENDWHVLHAWHNDPDVLYFSEGDNITQWSLEDIQSLYRSLSQNALLFILKVQGKPVGDGWLQRMNLSRILKRYPDQDCRRIDLAIGEKSLWGHGYGTQTIQLLTQLAFDLGVDAVFGIDIADYNPRSRRAFEKVGYQLDQVITGAPGAKARETYDLIIRRDTQKQE